VGAGSEKIESGDKDPGIEDHGEDIAATIGVILIIVGRVGLIISLLLGMVWSDREARRARYVDRAGGREAPPPEAY
jgi:hypothetical protein